MKVRDLMAILADYKPDTEVVFNYEVDGDLYTVQWCSSVLADATLHLCIGDLPDAWW